jgi:hypothetical protein
MESNVLEDGDFLKGSGSCAGEQGTKKWHLDGSVRSGGCQASKTPIHSNNSKKANEAVEKL